MSQIHIILSGRFIILTLMLLNVFYFRLLTGQSLPKPTYITTEDGLGNRFVTSIGMDTRNLLWIGTTQGLERFDGVEFLKINNNRKADIYFPGSNVSVTAIILLNEFTLWVIIDEKLYALDLCTYTWGEVFLPETLQGKITHIFKTGENEVFLNSIKNDKILLIKYEDGMFTIWDTTAIAKINITSIAKDSKKNIWWATPLEGIKVIDQNLKIVKTLKPDSINWYGSKIFSVPIFIDSKDRVFLFPKSVYELWEYFPETGSKRVIAKGMESPFYNAIEDKQGNLWCYGRKQLLRLKPHLNEFHVLDVTDHINKKLNYTLIKQLYEDNSSILWIATNNGLIKLPVGPQLIDNYLVIPEQEWGNEMRAIFESNDGYIYTYCENYTPGLHKINVRNQTSQLLTHYYVQNKANDVLHGGKSFCYDKRLNKAYFLVDDIISIDLKNNHVTTEWYCSEITDKLDRNPIDFLSDSILILGSSPSKTTLYDPINKKSLVRFNKLPNDNDIKNSCFGEDKFGNIWIGTNRGIYITNRNGELLKHIHTGSSPAISNNMILTIVQDMHQNVWLGTLGGGVNFVKFNDNKSTGNAKTNDYNSKMTITFINKEEGLCNENVPGILEDNYGYLWFSTFDGLARYQPYTKTFQTFISSDGISNNEFNYASAFKDSKGNLWFGGLNGINKIDPGQTIASKQTASLELISFTKYNRNSNLQERRFISDNDQPQVYEISPYDSWFQFNWTLPNYINNQKNNYYIKLEGLNDIWQYNGNLAFIRYHNLTPGDYTLHIKGADSKGNWSPDEISIKIIVNPIFYQTWWFRFLIFSIAGCIVYYVYKYNLNKKLEMERMRVRIASDLHDEVGSMLSGLAMQSELLQLDNNTSSQSKLENIANISRNVIGKMRDLVWSIDSRRDTVQDLIDRMQDAVSEVLQERDIAYLFEVGELPMQKELPIIVRQQLFLIFNEAITNIVRHSDATIVNLKIGNYSENFILTVFDNGSKNPNGHKISGLGLDNMRMRAQKIGAKFSIDTKDGYKVTITMAKL